MRAIWRELTILARVRVHGSACPESLPYLGGVRAARARFPLFLARTRLLGQRRMSFQLAVRQYCPLRVRVVVVVVQVSARAWVCVGECAHSQAADFCEVALWAF